MSDVPPDFEPLFRRSPFLELLGPIYNKRNENQLIIGFRVLEKHCNARGSLHGGVVSSVADIALGYNAAQTTEKPLPLVTASLTVDFAGSAKLGDWVEIETDIQKVGRKLAFANCYFFIDSKRIARASAVFSVPEAQQ
ncbi:MAG: PaaI family thioesterase [Pseudomonadota bacterium]